MRFSILAAGMTASLCAATGLWGQEASDEPLDEVIVTAAPLGDFLQPSRVLGDEELLLKRESTLGETLANELGVSSSYFGPAASRPIIRGLSGSRVTMLSDAISTLDVSDVSSDHGVAVEPLLAEQVEIIRGPATLVYGNAAAGGVVNVLDNRIPKRLPESPFGGGVELRGDTAAEERAVVGRLDGAVGRLAWHVDAFTRETEDIDIDGFATADPAERPEDEREGTLANSFSESDGFAGGVSWVAERGYLGVSISGLDNQYGLPGPEEEEEGEGDAEEEIAGGPFLDMEQTRIDVRGEYRFEGGLWERLKLAFGTNDYEHAEVEPSGEIGTLFENDAWQARLEAAHAALLGWRGAIGLQFDDRDFSAIGEEAFVSPTTTESWGVFLVEQRELSWGQLHLGARVESLEHENATLAGYDDTAFSLAAGLAIDIVDNHALIANLSRTERHPAAEELYSNGPHIATRQFEVGLLIGGEGSDTEDTINLDVGLRGEADDLEWAVSVFYSDITDYIYQDLTGEVEDGLLVAQYTQDDAEFYGFEAEVMFPLTTGGAFGPKLRLFADYVKAELDDGSDLPRIPPLRIGANFEIGHENWRAGLDAIYHAEQDDISSFATDSYTMVNLSIVYRQDWQQMSWELFARGTNLLDEDARKSTSFLAAFAPLPGASLHAGVRARF